MITRINDLVEQMLVAEIYPSTREICWDSQLVIVPLPRANLISLLMHYLSVLSFKLFDVQACELKLSFIF